MMFFQFKLIVRRLFKNRVYSVINLAGLATALTCVLFLFLWISDELSFDRFHKNINNLYQVQENFKTKEGLHERSSYTPYSIASEFREKIPEIEKSSGYDRPGRLKLKYKDEVDFEWNARCVSPEFLSMFSFEMMEGDPETALKDPYSIVLPENYVQQLFKDEDPFNKIIEINEEYSFRVTGIIKEIPENSTLDFAFLLPMSFTKTLGRWNDQWGSSSIQTYVQLNENARIDDVNEKMSQLLREHLTLEFSSDPRNAIPRAGFALAPFRDLHLFSWGDYKSGLDNIHYVYIFSAIALFILITAGINFMNLSIARSLKGAKDIGVKKVSGASRLNILKQFLVETFLFVIIAISLAFLLINLLLPAFNNLSEKEIIFSQLRSPRFLIFTLLLVVLSTLLSGAYPAFFLSSFKPANVLKGNKLTDNSNVVFRKGLVVFQFVISIWLIIGTLLVAKQINFIQNKNLGIEKNQILCLQTSGTVSKFYPTLKAELVKYSGIRSVTASKDLPIDIGSGTTGFHWKGKDLTQDFSIRYTTVDYNYFETLEIEFLEGRSYSEEFPTDEQTSYIINETAVKAMGVQSAVDMPCTFWGQKGKIIGVIKDFHFQSLQNPIRPLILILKPKRTNVALINIKNTNVQQTMSYIEKTWDKVTGGNNPINLRFLNHEIQYFYERDIRTSNLLKLFTAISILIACLGLFGLSSFMIENRNKEIGVRKVNGARVFEIIRLLNTDFTIWVFVAFVIATPIGFLAVQKWLTNFAFRTDISWWVFALAGILTITITFLTVSWQCWRAASRNPVESLRYE